MKVLKIFLLTVLGLSLVLTAAPVTAGKIKDMKYPALNKFEIPEPTKEVLDNGITVYLMEDHTLPLVDLRVIMNKCGSYLEPPHLVGLASMTGEVMRTGGTETMTGDQIDEQLEAIGASVETGMGAVSSSAGANALSEYSEKIIAILADVLRRPVFDEDKIELAKSNQKSGISRRNDEPIPIAIREFRNLVYGANSPYARHTEYSSIDAVTRDDMIMFHKTVVQPNNIQIAVIGDFDKAEMMVLLKKYLGDWTRGEVELPPPPEVQYDFKQTVNYAPKTDLTQSTILMGHIGGKMGDPDYAATIVMSAILGEGFGSRMFSNLRTKMGLAYAAGGSYSFGYDFQGVFISYIITKSGTTAKAIGAMKEEIASMQTVLPNEREMKLAKDGWLNSFIFNFDTEGEIIGRMMTYDYYGLPRDYLQTLKTKVENLTPEDIREVAKRKLNPDNLQMIVVGNSEDFDQPLSTFGEVTTLDIEIPGPTQDEFSATDEELSRGREIFAKSADACGGPASFRDIKTVTYDAKITITTPQGAFTLDAQSIEILPDKSAQIMKTPMGEQTSVNNGNEGWQGAGEQIQAMSASDVADFKKGQERELKLLFAKADNPDFKVASKGMEDFGGKQVERLNFLTNSGEQFTIFINPDDFMPVGMVYVGKTMAGVGVNTISYLAHTKAGAVTLPSSIKRDSGGILLEIEISNFVINGTVDESIFVKPTGI